METARWYSLNIDDRLIKDTNTSGVVFEDKYDYYLMFEAKYENQYFLSSTYKRKNGSNYTAKKNHTTANTYNTSSFYQSANPLKIKVQSFRVF